MGGGELECAAILPDPRSQRCGMKQTNKQNNLEAKTTVRLRAAVGAVCEGQGHVWKEWGGHEPKQPPSAWHCLFHTSEQLKGKRYFKTVKVRAVRRHLVNCWPQGQSQVLSLSGLSAPRTCWFRAV